MVCAEEKELLEQIARRDAGMCAARLSLREKLIADALQQRGLIHFDVALCITDAGRKALGVH